MARPADPHAHAALVAAARQEFARHGIQRARIEDITAACGLSKGAFYLHFESKEALFQEVVGALQHAFERFRRERARAVRASLASPAPGARAAIVALEAQEDRKLLELFWSWRDVISVLLSGSQGTAFEGVVWAMLDHEVSRVEQELAGLKALGAIRDDVAGDVVGMMVVGTYLLVARRFARLERKPDFDHWVRALQTLLAEGTAPAAPRRLRAPRAASRSRQKGPRAPRTAAKKEGRS